MNTNNDSVVAFVDAAVDLWRDMEARNGATWWAVVKYLPVTETRGSRWSVRVGRARAVVSYDHALSGRERAVAASADLVRRESGVDTPGRWAYGRALRVVNCEWVDALDVYIVVWGLVGDE